MKWNTTITSIGANAIDPKEDIVILFGEQATVEIQDVAIVQRFDEETPQSSFVFKKDDSVTIDGETYLALYVGQLVQSNVKAIGHATLVFTDHVPEQKLQNAIYLDKKESDPMPSFKVGDWISFEHK
ncbi:MULTISPECIES: PTS glucitol/sorbitol transporter subunit IIA [Amylolactobacillus]|nr:MULTISPECIES: PTS glucitol/sorbitol transporter subunit IIA [Amylolactobacillus]APT18925.1 PTS sorbitol transporter subunit IIA [Amylolactobacillus amylophilus DSM 20533 = JCM 1125]GED80040.1 PTS sorbitol transporter subunit IIA [Amylolactobacillus amylophilus]